MQKIFVVNIGDKYGPIYEEYLKRKLSMYDLQIIKQPYDPSVILQWNKMYPMSLDIDEPVCVIDIDILLVNDYQQMFDYPIERGQFVAMSGWWNSDIPINGGFFKYYPKDCRYIYDKYMSDISHWNSYYIKKGFTKGPVNGEQFFVHDSVKERLELIVLPANWSMRWVDDKFPVSKGWEERMTIRWQQLTGNNYIYKDKKFHPDVKIVHFNHTLNKPHQWRDYNEHY